ncbi:MAG: Rib/alpha-like domain-containing protein, partial [Gemella sp.]|nr:Rib/alpha-like domain-containing protein [Gemella sp.]
MFNKHNETKQRFTIKKYSFGVASALIGIFFAGATAQANEVTTPETSVVAPAATAAEKVAEVVTSSAAAQTPKVDTTTAAPKVESTTATTAAPKTESTNVAPKTETTPAPKAEETAPVAKEVPKAEATRTASVTYKVTYTDVATKEVVFSANRSANTKTTVAVANIPVTEKANLKAAPQLAEYTLAPEQGEVIITSILEKGATSKTVNFDVVKALPVATRKDEEAPVVKEAPVFFSAENPTAEEEFGNPLSQPNAVAHKVGDQILFIDPTKTMKPQFKEVVAQRPGTGSLAANVAFYAQPGVEYTLKNAADDSIIPFTYAKVTAPGATGIDHLRPFETGGPTGVDLKVGDQVYLEGVNNLTKEVKRSDVYTITEATRTNPSPIYTLQVATGSIFTRSTFQTSPTLELQVGAVPTALKWSKGAFFDDKVTSSIKYDVHTDAATRVVVPTDLDRNNQLKFYAGIGDGSGYYYQVQDNMYFIDNTKPELSVDGNLPNDPNREITGFAYLRAMAPDRRFDQGKQMIDIPITTKSTNGQVDHIQVTTDSLGDIAALGLTFELTKNEANETVGVIKGSIAEPGTYFLVVAARDNVADNISTDPKYDKPQPNGDGNGYVGGDLFTEYVGTKEEPTDKFKLVSVQQVKIVVNDTMPPVVTVEDNVAGTPEIKTTISDNVAPVALEVTYPDSDGRPAKTVEYVLDTTDPKAPVYKGEDGSVVAIENPTYDARGNVVLKKTDLKLTLPVPAGVVIPEGSQVKVEVEDAARNEASSTNNITNEAPVVENLPAPKTVKYGTQITDEELLNGVTKTDKEDDSVTGIRGDKATIKVTDKGGLDTTKPGTYTITYVAVDSQGKESAPKTTTITVEPLNGDNEPVTDGIEVPQGTPITGKDITDKVTNDPKYNPNGEFPPGTTVTVKDPSEIPGTDEKGTGTPGTKPSVTVVVTYPDGTIDEVEVPINVTPVTQTANIVFNVDGKDAEKFTETGASSSNIPTKQYEDTLAKYIKQGYEATSDTFKDSDKTFDKDAATDQDFKVVLVPKVVEVPKDAVPGQPVDPNNPNGPVWPAGVDKLVRTEEVNQTVTYEYADGTPVEADKAPTVTDKVEFTRTVSVNLVTGEPTYGDWTPVNNDTTFDAKKSPVVTGFLADKAEVPTKDGITATDADVTEKVVYKPIGKVVITNPDGSTTETPYPNDPTDPTKPGTPGPIPYVPGYTPTDGNGNPLTPVDPTDPTKGYNPPPVPTDGTTNTPIKYVIDKQKATIVFEIDGKEVDKVDLTGDSGTTIPSTDYDTKLAEYIKQGYEAKTDEFKDSDKTFDKDASKDQEFEVVLVPRVVDVPKDAKPGQPVDPNNPNGPVWPDTIANLETTEEEVTQTVTYVKEDGTEVATTVTDKVTFTRQAKVNLVTGEVTYTPWTAVNDDKTFDVKKSPVVEGYLADRAEVPARDVNATDADVVEKVVYKPVGKFVVTNPDGSTTETPYKNDPTDPTKVTNDKPTIPHVDGYTPVDGNGQPLKPVDPTDPTKGYIAPDVPTNGQPDTPIKYVPKDNVGNEPVTDGVEVPQGTPITEKDITDKVTNDPKYNPNGEFPPGTKVTVKDPSEIPGTDEKGTGTPGTKPSVTVVVEYPDGTTDEIEVPINVTPVDNLNNEPVTDGVEVPVGTTITEKDITDKVTNDPKYNPNGEFPPGTKVTVKDPSEIPGTDEKGTGTPGTKPSVTVVVTYPDGTIDEIEVPINVTPKPSTGGTPTDADKYTPVVGTVEVPEGTPITDKDITDKVTIPGLDKNTPGLELTVKDPLPGTGTAGDKGTVTVEIKYPDGTTEEVEVPVKVTPKPSTGGTPTDADKYTPVVGTVEVPEGTPITDKDITDKVTIPGLDKNTPGLELTVKDPLPGTGTAGDKGTVTVEIKYPDGTTEEVEVPVKVTPKPSTGGTPTDADKYTPVVGTVEVPEGTPIT